LTLSEAEAFVETALFGPDLRNRQRWEEGAQRRDAASRIVS
jgi:hypothetical protein